MDIALLLHGWEWNSYNNWFPWLQNELNKKMFDVYTPNLPNTFNPILWEQNDYINVYSSDFKNWWYIIAHSLWCQLAIKFIEENNIRNSIVILVAPTYPWLSWELGKEVFWDSYVNIKKYYNTENNFKKINKLNNKFYIFLSDNDCYINTLSAKKYYSKLENVKFVECKNKWHFSENEWIIELPEILECIK